MDWTTADLCDEHDVEVADPLFRHFGRRDAFAGPIHTVKVHEDNVLVRRELEGPGGGRVLVVDGGGSTRRALLGDRLATLLRDNDWAGAVVFGCIRDSAVIDTMDVGIKALATCPRKSDKHGAGQVGIVVSFAGVRFEPGAQLYADNDGIIIR